MKQLDVEIMGQRYLLTCPDGGESALLDAVARVDNAMCKIRDAGKVKARDRIAVLACLNLAAELSEALAKLAAPAATPTQTVAAPAPEQAPQIANANAHADVTLARLMQRLDDALRSAA